jgi:hypothetical protein
MVSCAANFELLKSPLPRRQVIAEHLAQPIQGVPLYSDDERTALEAEVKANPKDQGRLRDLAVIYLQSSKTAEKGKQIIEDLVKTREDSDSLMDLAACYYRRDHDETYRLSAKADKLNNGKSYTTSMIKLGMAEGKFGKGEFKEAEQLYQETLDKLIPTDMSIIAKIANFIDFVAISMDLMTLILAGRLCKCRLRWKNSNKLTK